MMIIHNAPTINGQTPFFVDDWLVFTHGPNGIGYVFTECDPAWNRFPGNPFSDEFVTAPRTALVGIKMLRRGESPLPLEDFVDASVRDHLLRLYTEATGRPPKLVELAEQACRIYRNAVDALGADLGGGSLTDLLADNMTHLPFDMIDEVILVAGLAVEPSCPRRRPFFPVAA
jgi:hypothetical protein